MLHWLYWLYWLYWLFFCSGGHFPAMRLRTEPCSGWPLSRRRYWREAELTLRRKADPEKLEMAWRLRRESTMVLEWIAKRVKMGVRTHV